VCLVSAALGSPGQANYASAKCFLDGWRAGRKWSFRPELMVGFWEQGGVARPHLAGRSGCGMRRKACCRCRWIGLSSDGAVRPEACCPLRLEWWDAKGSSRARGVPALYRVMLRAGSAGIWSGGDMSPCGAGWLRWATDGRKSTIELARTSRVLVSGARRGAGMPRKALVDSLWAVDCERVGAGWTSSRHCV